MLWYEALTVFLGLGFGSLALAWAVPGAIMNAVVSLGDPQRIVFIDNELSKDAEKLHSNLSCMVSANIGTRLFGYWLAYPFIKSRSSTTSVKFKIFMWFNSIGTWSWIATAICLFIAKLTGLMP